MHINYEIDILKADFKDIRNPIYQLSIQYLKSYSLIEYMENFWETVSL